MRRWRDSIAFQSASLLSGRRRLASVARYQVTSEGAIGKGSTIVPPTSADLLPMSASGCLRAATSKGHPTVSQNCPHGAVFASVHCGIFGNPPSEPPLTGSPECPSAGCLYRFAKGKHLQNTADPSLCKGQLFRPFLNPNRIHFVTERLPYAHKPVLVVGFHPFGDELCRGMIGESAILTVYQMQRPQP